MRAHSNEKYDWHREGGPFDVIAIAVSLVVIVGGLLVVHNASRQYTLTSYNAPPMANTLPVLDPASVPVPDRAPTQ
jgi:hypothetical protein